MALSRKFLSALGIEADKIDEIITAHTETVDGLKDQLGKYEADAKKLPGVQKQLDDLKAEAAKSGGKDYDALKKEYDEYKAATEKEKAQAAKERAYREALKDASLSEKGIAKALKYADWDAIELETDGKLKGAKDHIKAAKEEWAEYIETTTTKGASTATPPANNGGTKMTKKEIMAIKDAGERQKAIAENITLFKKG